MIGGVVIKVSDVEGLPDILRVDCVGGVIFIKKIDAQLSAREY